jgi:hypothetical protein
MDSIFVASEPPIDMGIKLQTPLYAFSIEAHQLYDRHEFVTVGIIIVNGNKISYRI